MWLVAGWLPAQEEARPERVLELIHDGSPRCLAHEWQQALVFLDAALELAPEDVEALKWRGHALTGAEDYAAARVDLDQAVRLGADDAWT